MAKLRRNSRSVWLRLNLREWGLVLHEMLKTTATCTSLLITDVDLALLTLSLLLSSFLIANFSLLLGGKLLLWAFLVAQMVKNMPAMQETWVQFLGQEDPLEKEMAIHSSTLAWKIPWTRSLIGYSPWGHKESDKTERLHSLTPSKNTATSAPIPARSH